MMYPAASAAIDLLLTGRKKVIFLDHVEIMKLGNLVPNFDSTSGDWIAIKSGIDMIKHKQKVKSVGCLYPAGMCEILERTTQN